MANYKIVDAEQLDATFTEIADAVRAKTGTNEAMLITDIASKINGIAAGGQDYLEAKIDGTLSEYSNNTITSIVSYAFAYCPSLTSVNFPVCTNIGGHAFYSCRSLTSINFPVCILSIMFLQIISLVSLSYIL